MLKCASVLAPGSARARCRRLLALRHFQLSREIAVFLAVASDWAARGGGLRGVHPLARSETSESPLVDGIQLAATTHSR